MKIIFISLDTLRANRLGCYGYHLPTSPYIDKIAGQGVLFESAFASDIPTEVAHTSIFTGKVGLTTGVVSHGSSLTYLPKEVKWLPTILRNAGYTTAAVDNLYNLKEWFARGYQYYINTVGKTRWIDGQTINTLAKPWINEHKDKDFFLFLHYWDPHTPYLPPKDYIPTFYDSSKNQYDPTNKSMESAFNHPAYPFFKYHHYDLLGKITDTNYVNALYDAEIRYLDDLLKDLDDYLIELGIQDETMLVLFGDHGESLTEHDIYWDHCGLYDQTVHIPLIIRWPNFIPAGKRIRSLVQHADLMPTLLEALNLEIPSDLDGKSLFPLIDEIVDKNHSEIYLSECAWQASRGIRTENYKYIETYDSGPFTRPPAELYDINNDPKEENNLIETHLEQANRFQKQLSNWVNDKIKFSEDPMEYVLRKQGLPFKRRIEKVLEEYGLTWDEWKANPRRERIDLATRKT
ncbi:sulfatase [Bacillus sp. FJAT-49711]|uniref:sulfatase n=1 Tax=Bacillus sp. FJAT-49711 TaxID=2833585 RepID=UPI001BCA3CC7|nr:sulfatase [Bacillus sp. FJAT-49711]MBS4217539.1 sulfatase [Bacillus sp. FJAT-49711]